MLATVVQTNSQRGSTVIFFGWVKSKKTNKKNPPCVIRLGEVPLPWCVFYRPGLVGEWSHIHVCPSHHIVQTVWFYEESVSAKLLESICFPDLQSATQLPLTVLWTRRTRNQTGGKAQPKQSFALWRRGAKRAPTPPPCESQPLSTLDGDELQLRDERFTCRLQIHGRLLPMKQIARGVTTPPQRVQPLHFLLLTALIVAPPDVTFAESFWFASSCYPPPPQKKF